jgi:hypothetical protein
MKAADYWIVLLLAVFNILAGAGLAFPLAKNLQQIRGERQKPLRYFLFFIGIYFAECVAFPMGMCTQIFTVALSFVWGLIFGQGLRVSINPDSIRDRITRLAILVAVYGSLPTASFCILITVLKIIEGGNILSASEGTAFGIPDFLPWPFNSILGFSAALLIGTLILKIVVTSVTVRYITRHSKIKAD